jgi:hypothetical protein
MVAVDNMDRNPLRARLARPCGVALTRLVRDITRHRLKCSGPSQANAELHRFVLGPPYSRLKG